MLRSVQSLRSGRNIYPFALDAVPLNEATTKERSNCHDGGNKESIEQTIVVRQFNVGKTLCWYELIKASCTSFVQDKREV